MEDQQQNTESRKRRRWPWIILGIFFVLVLGIRLSLKSSFVHNIVRSQIEQAANASLNGRLEIGKLEGDLWKEMQLTNVRVTSPDTVISADTLYARYQLLSYLGSALQVDEVRISNPYAHIRQYEDGSINLQNMVKESPTDTAESTTFLFQVDRFVLEGGALEGRFPSLGQASLVAVRDLNMEAAGSYLEEGYSLQLQELAFKISDTRLPSIEVQSTAQATNQQITLEKLVIGTGRSVLQSSATVNTNDSTGSVSFSAQPLSWRDIAAYVEPVPVHQNLQLELSLSGLPSLFNVGLRAQADGLQKLDLDAQFEWNNAVLLKRAELNIAQMDLETLTLDSTYPSIRELQLLAKGNVDVLQPQHAQMNGSFSANRVAQGSYRIDQLTGNFTLAQQELQTDIQVTRQGESLKAELLASRIWSSSPRFNSTVDGRNIQPGYWLQDPAYDGSVNVNARLEGVGLALSDQFWDYRLEVNDSQIGGQELSLATLEGQINSSRISATSQVRLQQSELDMTAQVDNYQTAPEYSYDLRLNKWNLAEFEGMEELPTSINAHLQGQGKYTTPEQLQLSSKIRIDSSMVNREFIEELHAEIVVEDTVAQVNDGRLRSDIADGNFESRMHLLRWYDIDNRLNMDFEIKDIQTFAGLAGVETLQTTGAITGQINPVNEDELQFTSSVDFENLQYGEMLSSEAIEGSVNILLREQPQYALELNLSNPVVNSVVLQDVSTTVRGKMTPDSTYGNIQLMFSSASGNRLQHEATYSVGSEMSRVQTTDLQIISDLRTLSLAQPFEAVIEGQQFRMDTLRLESKEGAAMEMAIPYADSVSQRGYLLGNELNLSVIQNTLLSESYFDGMLSGRLYLDKRDTLLSASGNLKFEQIAYNGFSLDSLDLKFEVDDERLEGGLLLFDRGERLATGQLQAPFKLGDPSTFKQSFYKEKISGRLIVRELSVSRYPELLENAGITNSDGLARFRGTISGTAGEPEMQASFRLRQATISGVGVDSVTATMEYDHTTRQLQMNSSIVSLKQKAAEITAQLPVHLDVKEFNIALPEQKDSIRVDINTNQLNLASLNDFVDRTEFREIQGRLDGSLVIQGPLNQLTAEGMMSFQNGAIRIMETGVKFSEIRSSVYFRGNRVEIEKMNARSGAGSFTASGSMNFDELQPGALDIAMKANNFRVANTADYSAIIDMDTKLNGTLSKPNIKGKLSFVSGFLYLQNFGEKSVESVELDSAAAPGYATSYMEYDSLSMEMDVSFDQRFFVRNRQYLDLEYELDGQVDLIKKREQDLQMFGALSASSGYARPLGKRFELEEGVITFRGEPTNPELNIRHLFVPPQKQLGDVRIWYIIEGTVEDPQFKYESEPPMGLEDIISYTLFGKPFLSLDPWRQVVANSGSNTSAADVAMDVLLDKVEALATERLGIDVVQIDNTRNGANSGTSIKTGWYLNPNLFFAIQNEITGSTPDTIFILEYLLKENLKLILTQGGDSQAGIDVRWNYDY